MIRARREVDDAHSAVAKLADNFVGTDPEAGARCDRRRRVGDGGRVDERARGFVRGDQRLDFRAQQAVTSTHVGE